MAGESILLQCYNKGCGQKYKSTDNRSDACTHHPGVPIFHDALKGWSCCKKKSTDFTEFLNVPGCTKGPHSNVKPPEPEKPQVSKEAKDEVVVVQAPKPKPADLPPRPPDDESRVPLPVTVAPSLKQQLEQRMHCMKILDDGPNSNERITEVPLGTSCKNNACKKSYSGAESNTETCWHHPGVPIFHEGMKYWSCCTRKTTEFDNFLAQEGCTEGEHVWMKVQEPKGPETACRYDWHQTSNTVTIAIYAKGVVPEESSVHVNHVTINVTLTFDYGLKSFTKLLTLFGVITPERSKVKMMSTKVEILLQKSDPISWRLLELPCQPTGDQSAGEASAHVQTT